LSFKTDRHATEQLIPMSTTKPRTQAALDAFDEGRVLPRPGQLPALTCELCGDSDSIVISSDVATLCIACATSLSKLPPSNIPTALSALRAARHMHLMSIDGGRSRR
jgi:hypothetical protein